MKQETYIGTMSGESLNGLDIVICDFNDKNKILQKSTHIQFPQQLRENLSSLLESSTVKYDKLGETTRQYSSFFANSINHFIRKNNIDRTQIMAIGQHCQTIYHEPDNYISMHISDNHYISSKTNLCVIGDMRKKTLALGGLESKLAPYIHLLNPKKNSPYIILNIGNTANITAIDKKQHVITYDTGPGNGLMNAWIKKYKNMAYDKNGNWAKSGNYNTELLLKLKNQIYFQLPPPKQTGSEFFNIDWLENIVSEFSIPTEDVQATLLMFTAETICDAIIQTLPQTADVYICGGGAHNQHLVKAVGNYLYNMKIHTTDVIGFSPDWLEACAFAFFAKLNIDNKSINILNASGTSRATVLGARYYP